MKTQTVSRFILINGDGAVGYPCTQLAQPHVPGNCIGGLASICALDSSRRYITYFTTNTSDEQVLIQRGQWRRLSDAKTATIGLS